MHFGLDGSSSVSSSVSKLATFAVSFRRNKSRRALAENLVSLTVLQYTSYIFPLLVLPYLSHVIGVERFGEIAFAQALIAYFSILVNFGFSYSATRQVASSRDDLTRLREIYSQVTWAKIFLAVLAFVIMVLFVEMQASRRAQLWLYLACYTTVGGSVLAPEWFFQGIEKMKYITVLGILARAVATLLVFAFVRSEGDYVWVPLLNGLGTIAAACTGQWLVWRDLGIRISRPGIRAIKQQIADSWDNFLANAFISLYTTSNAFVLGLLTNATNVGYYSAAEKVASGVRSLWGPVPQVLFPRFVRIFAADRNRGRCHLRVAVLVTGSATLLLSVAGCCAAPFLIRRYLGRQFEPSVRILQILVFTVLAIGVNNVLGVQGLVANRMNSIVRNIVLISGTANIVILIPAIRVFGIVGPAISVVLIETSIAISMWIALHRQQLI
jgi:polysaccharide transporter, PST family